MKKLRAVMVIIFLTVSNPPPQLQAQDPIMEIIKAGVIRVIKAVDLKIQRLQNKTIWLQNAQKVIENAMSEVKLKEISGWVEKQRSLYHNYYEELWEVKTIISYYQRIREVTEKQARLVKEYQRSWGLFKQDPHFTPNELVYMSQVYSGILTESTKNLDQIIAVLNSFTTQMTDAERLAIINQAADQVETNYHDLKAFNQQNILLSLQRAKARNEVEVVKQLYGLTD